VNLPALVGFASTKPKMCNNIADQAVLTLPAA
jgi:hypothetical protein